MRGSLRNLALCALSAVLGLATTLGLSGSQSDSGPDVVAAPQHPWVARVPVLNRIAAPPSDDVARVAMRQDDADHVEALVALAEQDPVGAIRAAAALERHWLKRDTLERIASIWAANAPAEALSYVNVSRDLGAARRSIRALVLETWARADPVGALIYLTGPVGGDLFFVDQPIASQAARAIANAEPYLMLTRADAGPTGFVRNQLRRSAIAVIAERDPDFAERQIALARTESEAAEWRAAMQLIEMQRNTTTGGRPD